MTKTEFFKHSFNLSEGQIKSITDAIKNKIPITLKLSKKHFMKDKLIYLLQNLIQLI